MGAILEEYLVMDPAQPSEAMLGGVHFIRHPAQASKARLGGVHSYFWLEFIFVLGYYRGAVKGYYVY